MRIIKLLLASDPGMQREALVVTGVAGLASATLVGIVNMAADYAAAQRPLDAHTVLLYIIAVAIYQIANRASLRGANALMQQRLTEVRLRLADGVRRADLRMLERLGQGRVFAVMAQETNYLAQNFPLTRLISQAPMFVQAHVGLATIGAIEQALDVPHPIGPEKARQEVPRFRDFQEIRYAGLRFSYYDAAGAPVFSTGPLDLRLIRGETLFIVGGNGGGKSTTLRLMTGLYPAEAGVIKVDGVPLDHDGLAGFRELLAAIFVDFHLFDELYGLEDHDPAEARALIAEMGLSAKVDFRDGRFTNLRLSTGQRKRLALIAALLEDRPIYVFDEWAAEQDVHFRDYFYTRVLPQMKAQGKTIVAVSHDERFWHVADRVARLDLGVMLWEKSGAESNAEERPGHG